MAGIVMDALAPMATAALAQEAKAAVPAKFEMPLESSCIDHLKYDESRSELELKFVKGQTWYTYYDVPLSVVVELIEAPSAGSYFHRVISLNHSASLNPELVSRHQAKLKRLAAEERRKGDGFRASLLRKIDKLLGRS